MLRQPSRSNVVPLDGAAKDLNPIPSGEMDPICYLEKEEVKLSNPLTLSSLSSSPQDEKYGDDSENEIDTLTAPLLPQTTVTNLFFHYQKTQDSDLLFTSFDKKNLRQLHDILNNFDQYTQKHQQTLKKTTQDFLRNLLQKYITNKEGLEEPGVLLRIFEPATRTLPLALQETRLDLLDEKMSDKDTLSPLMEKFIHSFVSQTEPCDPETQDLRQIFITTLQKQEDTEIANALAEIIAEGKESILKNPPALTPREYKTDLNSAEDELDDSVWAESRSKNPVKAVEAVEALEDYEEVGVDFDPDEPYDPNLVLMKVDPNTHEVNPYNSAGYPDYLVRWFPSLIAARYDVFSESELRDKVRYEAEKEFNQSIQNLLRDFFKKEKIRWNTLTPQEKEAIKKLKEECFNLYIEELISADFRSRSQSKAYFERINFLKSISLTLFSILLSLTFAMNAGAFCAGVPLSSGILQTFSTLPLAKKLLFLLGSGSSMLVNAKINYKLLPTNIPAALRNLLNIPNDFWRNAPVLIFAFSTAISAAIIGAEAFSSPALSAANAIASFVVMLVTRSYGFNNFINKIKQFFENYPGFTEESRKKFAKMHDEIFADPRIQDFVQKFIDKKIRDILAESQNNVTEENILQYRENHPEEIKKFNTEARAAYYKKIPWLEPSAFQFINLTITLATCLPLGLMYPQKLDVGMKEILEFFSQSHWDYTKIPLGVRGPINAILSIATPALLSSTVMTTEDTVKATYQYLQYSLENAESNWEKFVTIAGLIMDLGAAVVSGSAGKNIVLGSVQAPGSLVKDTFPKDSPQTEVFADSAWVNVTTVNATIVGKEFYKKPSTVTSQRFFKAIPSKKSAMAMTRVNSVASLPSPNDDNLESKFSPNLSSPLGPLPKSPVRSNWMSPKAPKSVRFDQSVKNSDLVKVSLRHTRSS